MRYFLLSICFLSTMIAYSQGKPLQEDSLVQLKKSETVVHEYLNFDVLKLMVGQGRSTSSFRNSMNYSVRLQLLVPFALSKRLLKIAYGLTYGTSKIRSLKSQLVFNNDELVSVNQDKSISFSKIRTESIGIIALRVERLRTVTIMYGPSLEYNISSSVKTKISGKGKDYYSILRAVNRWSVPLHLQLSISRKQFAAFGFFGRYDTQSLFESAGFNQVRHLTVGAAVSLIL